MAKYKNISVYQMFLFNTCIVHIEQINKTL